VERHIIPFLGAVRLADLTPELVDGWIGDLITPPEDGTKARLGSTSVRLCRKTLSMALEEAVQRGHLARNPVPLTQPPRRDRTYQRLGWTIDEARTFLASVADHRLGAMFHLALVTGLRRGELLGLRWVDVDFDDRSIRVVQQLAVEGNRPIFKQLKTESSERVVTFGSGTVEVLNRHRKRQDEEAVAAAEIWEDTELVFTTQLGGWLDPQNTGRLMDGLCAAAGVPRITPKGLRHTAQSIGRVVVGDDKVMQERLGHADIGVTLNTYTFTVDDQHRRAGQRIDEVFAEAGDPASPKRRHRRGKLST
jgi:integrase